LFDIRLMQIFTIVSGDYVYGAAALCNSLCLAGIKSEIHIGYTGKLEWEIDRTAPIITHELPKSLFWIGNYKPKLLMDHAAGIFLYVDADCVVSSGAFLDHVRDAIAAGPVFCAEGIVPEQDIRRRIWAQAKEHSTKTCGTLEQIDGRRSTATYFNSGFLGGEIARDRWVLEGWEGLIRTALRGEGKLFENLYFPMPDQDCLNAFIQDERFAFSCISPPDVWYAAAPVNPFLQVGLYESSLLHCTGEKPWRLRGVPPRLPNRYELEWYRLVCTDAPWVRCYPRLSRTVASWLQRGTLGRAVSRLRRIERRFSAL
jgi:hypothetical protein